MTLCYTAFRSKSHHTDAVHMHPVHIPAHYEYNRPGRVAEPQEIHITGTHLYNEIVKPNRKQTETET